MTYYLNIGMNYECALNVIFSFVVPSRNKADQRSIEETMNAIRERKKMKLDTVPDEVK